MAEFLDAVARHSFLQQALLAGILASLACGVVGTFVVTRRIAFLAGGIAHFVLGGLGVARYLQQVHGWQELRPLHGALVAAVLGAAAIRWITRHAREREDTAIAALWAVGMAVGVVAIARTPGYNENLLSYLFGNILMVTRADLLLIAAVDAVVLLCVLVLYRPLLAASFDEEFARLRGVPVDWLTLLLLTLTALTVVVLLAVVGVVLALALLTLPAAAAGRFTRTLATMMVAASILALLATVGGLAVSYSANLPAGATTVLLAAALYVLAALGARTLRTRRS